MANVPAPSAKALLSQATKRWPTRSRGSDGIVPSAAHTASNPDSDHEMGKAGYCHAVDLTHDETHGCDCGLVSEGMRIARDRRIKYVIFNRRIFSSYPVTARPAWTWGPYVGSNPHSGHMHLSILDTKAACEDISLWPLTGEVVPTADGIPTVVIQRGSKGEFVKLAQKALNNHMRFWEKKLVVDGMFGGRTEMAARSFQKRKHLHIDGKISMDDWTLLGVRV